MAAAAHTAVLEIDGAKAKIVDLHYSFNRATDMEGQPAEVVRNGVISLSMRSDEAKMKGLMLKWMSTQDLAKTGSITIYQDADQKVELKKIEFENSYVVSYGESFSAGGGGANTMENVSITAEKIKVGEAAFGMKWPTTED